MAAMKDEGKLPTNISNKLEKKIVKQEIVPSFPTAVL